MAIRIINFQPRNFHTSPLLKQNSVLKFQDKICLENILFIIKSLNNVSPSVFNTWFSFSSGQHNYETYLSHYCLVWAQNCSAIQQIIILQKRAIRIINFQPRNFHTSPLFKQNSVLKFQDKICIENIFFVSKSLNNLSPPTFNDLVFPKINITMKPQVQHRVI